MLECLQLLLSPAFHKGTMKTGEFHGNAPEASQSGGGGRLAITFIHLKDCFGGKPISYVDVYTQAERGEKCLPHRGLLI